MVKMRVDVELNKYELAALFWDGMNGRYSESSLHTYVSKLPQFSSGVAKSLIRDAVARYGQDSVCCGPGHPWTDSQERWCLTQVTRIFEFEGKRKALEAP